MELLWTFTFTLHPHWFKTARTFCLFLGKGVQGVSCKQMPRVALATKLFSNLSYDSSIAKHLDKIQWNDKLVERTMFCCRIYSNSQLKIYTQTTWFVFFFFFAFHFYIFHREKIHWFYCFIWSIWKKNSSNHIPYTATMPVLQRWSS